MKYSTIHLGNNKIEIFNSFLGKETIKLNGEIVSEKNSITGAKHNFKIIENDRKVDCKLILGYGANGVVMDLYRDNMPIIESPKSSYLVIMFLFILLIVIITLTQVAFHYS
ncbi:hypothetical protein [Flavobacterium granuli]|uniref:Uncharacterized protein n=1 Tax=Flavobacterium granuli TaxID=280093 RepID=A0A1M5RBR4_9FLAO|nr:hypothetical protein [Flavobacterium granuli]PRZ21686.1 hypothetical protein BC624_108127 [Flavobacterium granuli]SHH23745.1 hypothetical protein SAMN05443373_109126 [Flavobacterium granuli]